MEADQDDQAENLCDEKLDHKMGRDFRRLTHHPAMVCNFLIYLLQIK